MLHQLLKSTLQSNPERVLLQFNHQQWTARQLEERATRIALALTARGVEPGDRVACLLPNCPELVLTYLACFKAGFIAVPLDYRHHPRQIGYALRHSGAVAFLVHPDRLPELAKSDELQDVEHLITVGDQTIADTVPLDELLAENRSAVLPTQFEDDDLAVMIYTSGTTSRPKGVTLSRASLVAGIRKFLALIPLKAEDNNLIASPISRPFALRTQLLTTLFAGARVTLLERFDPDGYLAALKQEPKKTILALLPSALEKIVHHPDVCRDDFSKLRLCIAGGDRVPIQLHEDFRALTGLELTEQCGMSEVGMYALNPPFGRKKPGSIGLPMYGTQVCIVDREGNDVPVGECGEIIVNSPLAMDGYWNDTAQTRKALRAGWIRTGDVGRFDQDGYLWFVGRKKDIIVRDGSNIAPMEIELVLLDHPWVREVCVVGISDRVHGQEIHCFATLSTEAPGDVVGEELLAFTRNTLAEYQEPTALTVVEELPRTGAGKIDRDRLVWQAEAGTANL